AADLDAVAEHLDIAGLAEYAMVELVAALGHPFEQLDGAVDRDVFLVAGDQKRDRALRLATVRRQIFQHRGDAAGDAALHVHGAAAIEQAVLDLARERAMAPRRLIAGGHYVGVPGKADMRRGRADPGIEVVDVGGAGLAEGDAMDLEAGRFQDIFEDSERAGIGRGDRGAAQQFAGNGKRIIHGPRLTWAPGDGPALCGTNCSSLA